jgi:hypothetical protein
LTSEGYDFIDGVQFFKGSSKVDQMSGADPRKLEALIQKHQGPNELSEEERDLPAGQVCIATLSLCSLFEILPTSLDIAQ